MGSLSQSAWVDLDVLARNPIPNVPLETVVETVWAITHFVYTNDHEVNFVRHQPWAPKSDREKNSSIIRSFTVDQTSKPSDIAKLGCDVSNDEPPQLDPSAPQFTQLVRKISLLFTYDDDRGLEHEPPSQDKVSFSF